MTKSILFLFSFLLSASLLGQNVNLANDYYKNGEYEKAATIFEKLVSQRPSAGSYYFTRYLECLTALGEFDKAKKATEKQLKSAKNKSPFYIHLGHLLEKEGKVEKAEKNYRKAIENMGANHAFVSATASAFKSYRKNEWAIEAYVQGAKILDKEAQYASQIAALYRQEQDYSKMVEYYLISLQNENMDAGKLKSLFARSLKTEEELDDLVQQLYIQIQERPDDLDYLELLEWVFIQKKDYKNALRQAKAIDKRSNGQGRKVYGLAEIADNAGDYSAAIDAYQYITTELGPENPYYFAALMQSLNSQRRSIVLSEKYEKEDLLALRNDYQSFIDQWGTTSQTAPILTQWARLELLYLNDVDRTIDLLDQTISIPGLKDGPLNDAKLLLGDAYLIKGEIWESTLLYGQVDKAAREDVLGEKARYKNARLYYFQGDFEWAQAQFDILKAATSRLISNDAIDQSVFIMDNLGLDTTPVPLQMYARAELLQYQNQGDAAFATLDSITAVFPNHSLEDDIWYLKANVHKKRQEYQQAINYYQQIIDSYPEDIRADNAIYELAQVYEIFLGDEERAMPYYEKLFIEYSGSTLAVDARKRFRQLRGDNI